MSQAVELLQQVASVDPADYERQMVATAASVRAVGSFIAELADRCARCWSLPACASCP